MLAEIQTSTVAFRGYLCHGKHYRRARILRTIFEEPDIVSRNGLDQVTGGRYLAKSDSEVVGIVESIEEVFMKWVNVL